MANFCTNCGTKIDKSNIKQNNDLQKSASNSLTEEKKRLKTIDEIFESEEIKSEIRKNKSDPMHVIYIKDILKDKIINEFLKNLGNQI
ncbi:hypothetical protein [Methanobrevibacter sp.]|uniref:hypothetical protein n=1 Tax=Methanobrevibacter sp. TaxID=66852 RepID=UPI0025E9EFF6|nr:hypothetical protein [Methanobrevibacter sp.]MBQ2665322.1 hypothetical protein [Methanobrevibacter sp.]